jgi:2-iminobutanoate/2-iminopropanoate deaminase
MPKREIKHPDRAASTGTYSDGVILDGWLYISGQGPLDLKTGAVISGSIETETTKAPPCSNWRPAARTRPTRASG